MKILSLFLTADLWRRGGSWGLYFVKLGVGCPPDGDYMAYEVVHDCSADQGFQQSLVHSVHQPRQEALLHICNKNNANLINNISQIIISFI